MIIERMSGPSCCCILSERRLRSSLHEKQFSYNARNELCEVHGINLTTSASVAVSRNMFGFIVITVAAMVAIPSSNYHCHGGRGSRGRKRLGTALML